MRTLRAVVGPVCLAVVIGAASVSARGDAGEAPSASGGLKAEHFDHDPGWEGSNNRVEPEHRKVSEQDFGYSRTQFAAMQPGEVGGRVQRSTVPAYYAERIPARTLNDKMSASGTFDVTDLEGSNASLLFGWFNSEQPGGGRPMASLGLNLGYHRVGGHLSVRLITSQNQSFGQSITPVIKPKPRGDEAAERLPLRKGVRYAWKLDYDPEGADGNGRLTFSIRGDRDTHDDFEGKTFTIDLPAGYRKQGATFDRFGMMNMMKSGGAITIYFGDVKRDGTALDLSTDPGWVGSGNRGSFTEVEQAGVQNFGYSEGTNFAGSSPGEIGGTIWRVAGGSYADRVGRLTLEDRLEVHGKVRLVVGAPDSAVYLGWFNSGNSRLEPEKTDPAHNGNFLGVAVGGPTRVGHYFAPAYTTAKGVRGRTDSAPVLAPGTSYDFSLVYDPAGDGGKGTISVKLGDNSATLSLKSGAKADGATFDRFGLFSGGHGGQMVRIYLDDLQYTAGHAVP